MQTSENLDKLLPALMKARQTISPTKKGGVNKFDDYAYATLEDWHNAVMPALLENGLMLSFSTISVENLEPRVTKKTKNGKETTSYQYVVQVICEGRLWHTSGQWIEIGGVGQGQDRADKGVYKALTGCAKYLYAQLFALPTTDDPEGDSTVGDTDGSPRASTPNASKAEDVI